MQEIVSMYKKGPDAQAQWMGLRIGRQLPLELASSDACSQTNSETH